MSRFHRFRLVFPKFVRRRMKIDKMKTKRKRKKKILSFISYLALLWTVSCRRRCFWSRFLYNRRSILCNCYSTIFTANDTFCLDRLTIVHVGISILSIIIIVYNSIIAIVCDSHSSRDHISLTVDMIMVFSIVEENSFCAVAIWWCHSSRWCCCCCNCVSSTVICSHWVFYGCVFLFMKNWRKRIRRKTKKISKLLWLLFSWS